MEVNFHIPHSLAPLVHVIWEQRSSGSSAWRILPSGKVELIFNLGPRMDRVEGKRVGGSFDPTAWFCFLSGLHTRPLDMSFHNFHVIGVQMEPIAVKALFGIPCEEVRDWAVHGEELLTEIHMIEDHLRGPGTFHEKACWLEGHLHGLFVRSPDIAQAVQLRSAVAVMVAEGKEGQRVRPEDRLGYSRMHTNRLFKEWMGLPPGAYLRLQRFVGAVHHLHGSSGELTSVAYANGYHDQAHFIHSFQNFAGMAPGRYRALRTDLPGQLAL